MPPPAGGAGRARYLRAAGVSVVEIDRPDRRSRRARGKSDPIDAYSAARTGLSGARSVVPKAGDGIVEVIRALRVTRRSAYPDHQPAQVAAGHRPIADPGTRSFSEMEDEGGARRNRRAMSS